MLSESRSTDHAHLGSIQQNHHAAARIRDADSFLPPIAALRWSEMGTLDGIGVGFIAGDALALIVTIAAPDRPLHGLFTLDAPEAEQACRDRNARAGASVGSCATLIGAILLLVSSGTWATSLPAAACVITASWFVLAYQTRCQYELVARSFRSARDSPKGTIRQSQAIYVGMGGHYEPGREMHDGPISDADEAIRRAEEGATWRWALQHPLGARGGGL